MGLTASAVSDCIVTGMGIDWVTCSSTSPESHRRYAREFGRCVLADRQQGYETVPAGFHGYSGHKTRHAGLYHHSERSLLMVSGAAAQRASLVARIGDNCSRIDIQCTVRVGEQHVAGFLAKQHARIREGRTLRGHTQYTRLEIVNGEAQTLYVGKRTSDVYVRLYDKFAESGDEAHRGCVRLEIEYKGKRSKAIWECLANGTLRGMSLIYMLLTDLSERGVDTSMIDIERQDIRLPKPKPSKENVTLGWWASQVAPSVARHVAERGWYTAFQTLFRECLTELDKTLILNAVSLNWGN